MHFYINGFCRLQRRLLFPQNAKPKHPRGYSAFQQIINRAQKQKGKTHLYLCVILRPRIIYVNTYNCYYFTCHGSISSGVIEKEHGRSRELIVCGEQIPPEILSLHQHDLNILFKSSANAGRLAACAPFTLSYPVPDHGSTGYLCENGACRKTDTDLRALIL